MLLTLFIITVYIFYMQCVKATINAIEHLYIILMFVLLLLSLHHYDGQLRQLQQRIDTMVWNKSNKSTLNMIQTIVEFILKDYRSSNLRYSINRLKNFFVRIK